MYDSERSALSGGELGGCRLLALVDANSSANGFTRNRNATAAGERKDSEATHP